MGDQSLDPQFANDPIIGATIHIGNFTLGGMMGDGYLFCGGSLTISKNGTTYLSAEIPNLLVDDSAVAGYGANIWGPEVIDTIDTADSPFLAAANSSWSAGVLPELIGLTSTPVCSSIAAGQGFSVTGQRTQGSCVPEPTAFVLLLAGAAGLPAFAWRNRRVAGRPAEPTTTATEPLPEGGFSPKREQARSRASLYLNRG